MTEKEYKESMDSLDEQRRRVTATPEAAREFLESLKILHLFVPKGSKEVFKLEIPDDYCPDY